MKIVFKIKNDTTYEFNCIKKIWELITTKLELEHTYTEGLVQGITKAFGEIEIFKIGNIRII